MLEPNLVILVIRREDKLEFCFGRDGLFISIFDVLLALWAVSLVLGRRCLEWNLAHAFGEAQNGFEGCRNEEPRFELHFFDDVQRVSGQQEFELRFDFRAS